jgi:hypothetical protein
VKHAAMMNDNYTFGKDVEGSFCGLSSNNIPALSGGTEEILRKVNQVFQRPGSD